MNNLSEMQVRYLLCGALSEPVLIITVSDDTAMQIKEDIMIVVRSFLCEKVNRRYHRYNICIGGYECITVMPYREWCKTQYKLKHTGLLLITNRQIPRIPMTEKQPVMLGEYLAECEEKYARILERRSKNDKRRVEKSRR